jgi:hypothetical protein
MKRLTAGATSGIGLVALLALLDFVLQMLVAGNYGYFRDELYHILAGKRLAIGYVDFPLMVALLAALMHRATSDLLVAIHVIPAMVSALLVFLTGLMARELENSLRAIPCGTGGLRLR